MKKKLSAVSDQRTAKNSLIMVSVVLALFTATSVAAEKGTLVIPKRETKTTTQDEQTEIVERIQKTFAEINDIKGNFTQTSYIKDLEETQKYSGAFFIKKPADMMWEYTEPRDEKITIHDDITYIYKRAENQVIKTKFSKEAYSQVPLALLSSFENISTDFHISMPEKNALQLIPKKKMGFIQTLVFETVPEGFPVSMFTVIDTYGNIIMIELDKIALNNGLKDDFFLFNIPENAEVYDMSE